MSTRVIYQGNNADNSGGTLCGGFYDHGSTKALRHTLKFTDTAFCGNFMAPHPNGLGSGAVSKLTGGRHSFEHCVLGGSIAGNGTDTKDREHDVAHCCCLGHESGGHCYNCFGCSAEEEQYENTPVPGRDGLTVESSSCEGYSLVFTAPPADFAPHTELVGACVVGDEPVTIVREPFMEYVPDVPVNSRCSGAPEIVNGVKWNNMGTQASAGACAEACIATSACDYAVFNRANSACTAFAHCTTFQETTKEFDIMAKVLP